MPPRQRAKTDEAAQAAERNDAKKDENDTEKATKAAEKAAEKAARAEKERELPEADVVTAPEAEQEASAEAAGGDVEALAPSEKPSVDSEFHEDRTRDRISDAGESPQELHQDEQNDEQLPKPEQLTREYAGINKAGERGDSDGDDPEADLVESAGEKKNTGEADPSESDTAVVTAANQQQKSVGALARPESPADQNKTAIAESPVSPPNGERVVTYTTPPRVAVKDVVGEVPAEGDSGEITKREQRSGLQHPLVAQGQGLRTNGVTAGLETVDSGIIPDETVAETDGTVMVAGAPNETYDGTEAPDGLYVGAEVNAAPLQAPQPRQFSGAGETNQVPAMGAVGLQVTAAPISGQIVDSSTGEAPTDVDGLFVPQFTHGNVMVATKRLIERTGAQSGVLLVHVGKQVSAVAAEQIKARIRQQS